MTEITITSKFIELAKLFEGRKIQVQLVEDINRGIKNLLLGYVVELNYSQDQDSLEQVKIATDSGEFFTLTIEESVSLLRRKFIFLDGSEPPEKCEFNIFDILNVADLINTPREEWTKNLDDFKDTFKMASQFRQQIACIYDRITGDITLVRVISKDKIPGSNTNVIFHGDGRPPNW